MMASSTRRPVIAALESTFTPPAGCFSTLEAYTDHNTALLVPLAITASPASAAACFPPGYSSYAGIGGFYSPAVCPAGFTQACTVAANLLRGESAALCCPSNYACFSGTTGVYTGLSCSSTIGAETAVTQYTPNFSAAGWQSSAIITLPTESTTIALGYGIEVRWQSSDLSVFAGAPRTGAPPPTTTFPTITPTNTTPPNTTTTLQNAPASSHAGMSSGTKLALGLAIPIVVILLLFIFAFLLVIRRKRRSIKPRDKKTPYSEMRLPPPTPAELQAESDVVDHTAELNARTPSPVEIDGTRVPSPNTLAHIRRPGAAAVRGGGVSGYGDLQQQRRSGSGSRERQQYRREGSRGRDVYTISPVETGGMTMNSNMISAPPSASPSVRRPRRRSGPDTTTTTTPVSPVFPPHQRTNSAESGRRPSWENRHRRSGSGNRRVSDISAVSPVEPPGAGNGGGGGGGGGYIASRPPAALTRHSLDGSHPPIPPIPPIPPGHWYRGSRAQRVSSASAVSPVDPVGGPVSSPPAAVRRSTDDRAPLVPPKVPIVRRPVPTRIGTTPESSTGGSEEEREIAERYRMFLTYGANTESAYHG